MRRWLAVALVMCLGVVLAGSGLGQQALWDDEANTALFARNLRQQGDLTAWDGRNLIGYALGAELDADLRNVYMPPLQYGVAALSQAWFGDDTAGSRAFFVVLGVLSLALLAVWVHLMLGPTLPAWLPSLLLAVSPAYLLCVRNCRYYVLGVFLWSLLCCLWPWGKGDIHLFRCEKEECPLFPRRAVLRAGAGAIVTLLLVATNYLYAVSAVATLALWWSFGERRWRSADTLILVGCAAVLAVCGAYVVVNANPLTHSAADFRRALSFFSADGASEVSSGLLRLVVLWHYLRGIGRFEFLPIVLLCVFVLPRWSPRFAAHGELVRRALPLLATLLLWIALATLLSRTPGATLRVARMRYLYPLLPLCAVLGALAVMMLWRVRRAWGIAAALLAYGTNALSLSFIGETQLRSTLLEYVQELRCDYVDGHELAIQVLSTLPPDTTVLIEPPYFMYPAMYYLPRLRFAGQLDRDDPRLTSLPSYLALDSRQVPEVMLIANTNQQQAQFDAIARFYGDETLRWVGTIPLDSRVRSRPELHSHGFAASRPDEDAQYALVVLQARTSHLPFAWLAEHMLPTSK